ncbi:MAG: glycosyltransferase family 4 protein [Vicinamibacterales bacterium]
MRRPPVLHVIPFLWSGAGGVVTRLCEAQRQHGPVAIVTTGKTVEHADWPAYRTRLRRAGVTHHSIDFFHRDQDLFWSGVGQLQALIDDLRPGVIHAHAGVPACAVHAAREGGRNVRVIGQMYSWGPDRPEWMNRQDTWGLRQCDRVVCSAHSYSDLLVSYGVPAAKLVYLPWGLPLDRLPFESRLAPQSSGRRRHRPSGPVIGFVGRIEPRKGQLDLVNAFARVRKRLPAARLELVGPIADKAYAATVHAAVQRQGLDGAVVLAGKVREVQPWLLRWDLFVSMSSDEGQGLAVLEAMATGVPVLASPVAGIADFLTDGRTGFTLSAATARGVADRILHVLGRPTLLANVERGARRLVERRYSWDLTVSAFERLYWS